MLSAFTEIFPSNLLWYYDYHCEIVTEPFSGNKRMIFHLVFDQLITGNKHWSKTIRLIIVT